MANMWWAGECPKDINLGQMWGQMRFSCNMGRCIDATAIIGDRLKAEYLEEHRHES